MYYCLGNEDGGNKEAFDALDNAFGAKEFTLSEATVIVQNALYIKELEASRVVRGLVKSGTIKEAE